MVDLRDARHERSIKKLGNLHTPIPNVKDLINLFPKTP